MPREATLSNWLRSSKLWRSEYGRSARRVLMHAVMSLMKRQASSVGRLASFVKWLNPDR